MSQGVRGGRRLPARPGQPAGRQWHLPPARTDSGSPASAQLPYAITGTLVYFIDKALSRYQERHRHPA
jgi:hypothetical protein